MPRLNSRAKMIEQLLDRRNGHSHGYDFYLFAFNVKAYGAKLTFGHLLKLFLASGYADDEWCYEQPEYLAALEAEFDRVESDVWEWGVQGAWESVTDTDAYNTLQDGTDIDVEYGSFGRSSGWLVVTELLGKKFHSRMDRNDYREWLESLSRADLLLVFRFFTEAKKWFTPKAAASEVEHQAAYSFFKGHAEVTVPRPIRAEDQVGAGI